jgi:hypothetical protein
MGGVRRTHVVLAIAHLTPDWMFEVILVTRDLAVESLFYTMVRIQFSLTADGSVEFEYQSIFSPIVHYMYGLDGYDWYFREVVICEIMFSILFAFFVFREVRQLVFDRIIPGIKMLQQPTHDAPVSPDVSSFENGVEITTTLRRGSVDDEVKVVPSVSVKNNETLALV